MKGFVVSLCALFLLGGCVAGSSQLSPQQQDKVRDLEKTSVTDIAMSTEQTTQEPTKSIQANG